MLRISDLRMREIINTADGKKLGLIKDIDVDLEDGRIKAIVLPGTGKFMGIFGRNDDIVVPWDKIRKIGVDVVLVDLLPYSDPLHNSDGEYL